MDFDIKIEESGAEANDVLAILAHMKQRIENVRPVLESAAKRVIQPEIKRIFDAEGAYDGHSKWRTHSEGYKNRTGRILQDTREMLNELLSPRSVQITQNRLVINSTRTRGPWNIGALHQRGTTNMPSRPFLWITNGMQQGVMEMLANWIMPEVGEPMRAWWERTGKGSVFLQGPGGRFIKVPWHAQWTGTEWQL